MQVVLSILAIYAGLGALFAPLFAFKGAGAIDPVAKSSTIGFRLLILPGAIALWPMLLLKWIGAPKANGSTSPATTGDHS